MENQTTPQRIKAIYQMLFQMASGNLAFRILETDPNEPLGKLAEMLNNFAEELDAVLLKSGRIPPSYRYQNLARITLLLNNNFKIKGFTSDVPLFIKYTAENFLGIDFKEMLSEQSQHQWDQIKNQLRQDSNFSTTQQLLFLTPNEHAISSFCTISRLLHTNKFIINTSAIIPEDSKANLIENSSSPRESDAILAQRVSEYILINLEEPLPNVKDLSLLFGTNEFKIKKSFRNFFDTSIFQFYNEQRLKKAHLLIEQTNIPINEIAIMSGFTNYINFYKSFKKRFNYLPSTLNRASSITSE